MGGEVDFFVRVRLKAMAHRNIMNILSTERYRELYEALTPELQESVRFHALRGEYNDMMALLDKPKGLEDLTLSELRELGKKYHTFAWSRSCRHTLISQLARKGLK